MNNRIKVTPNSVSKELRGYEFLEGKSREMHECLFFDRIQSLAKLKKTEANIIRALSREARVSLFSLISSSLVVLTSGLIQFNISIRQYKTGSPTELLFASH